MAIRLGLVAIFVLLFGVQAHACTLVMGYRTTPRLPNIEAAPNNSGIYKDIYSLATRKIGCDLKIVRLPKKRILSQFERGVIDFYPGFTFTEPRAQFTYFIRNGLYTQVVGLSLAQVPEIRSFAELEGRVLLRSLGGPSLSIDGLDIHLHKVAELDYDTMSKMLLSQHADFFVDHYYNLKFFLKNHPMKSAFRFHMNCCGGPEPFLLGFSRNSKHYAEERNPDFRRDVPLGVDNFPVRLVASSVAYKLQQAIKQMEENGEIDQIVKQYYGL